MQLAKLLTDQQGEKMEINIDISDIAKVQGRTIIDYGDRGDGKSTRASSFARYYFKRSGGKKVRLVATEDSSKAVFQDLIDAGIVEPIFMTDSKNPLVTLERIMEGEWPLIGQFEEKEVIKKVNGIDTKSIQKVQKWQPLSEWEGSVSAYIVEGLTTACEIIQEYLTSTNRFPREQSDGFQIGNRTYMASSQTAYGFTQGEGIKLVRNAGMLPVERVLWTAHEAKGKDEFGGGGAVRGPKLVGSAATDVVRKYCGVLLHTDRITTGKSQELRTYVQSHPDATNPSVNWKAKVTMPPTVAAEFNKLYPDGYFKPTLPEPGNYDGDDGLIPFLKNEARLLAQSSNAAKQFALSISNKKD